MAKTIAIILGIGFLIVGGLGFILPDLLGMHLHPVHNAIHLISGALALFVGWTGSLRAARTFCLVFGGVYAALGIAGFIAGKGDGRIFTVIPDHLALGMMDHIVHIILGAVFLIGALATRPAVVAGHGEPRRAAP